MNDLISALLATILTTSSSRLEDTRQEPQGYSE